MIQSELIALGQSKAPTVIQLRALAKKLGIKNFGRMRKSELSNAIDEAQINMLETEETQEVRFEAPVDDSASYSENTTEASQNKQDYSTSDNLPKVLYNEWENGTAEDSTRQNCALVKSCATPAELTLLLNSAQGATLLRLYNAYRIVPFPYGGDKTKELQIRDFVEYEFRKREGADFLPLQPDILLDNLPNHEASSIEKFAHENLSLGILAEKQRVREFVREIDNAGSDFELFLDVIRKFDGVRFNNKSRDGFIDTFQMIFQTHNDLSLALNVVDCLRNDSVLREDARDNISFWKNQYACLQPVALDSKIRQALILARFDAWCEVIQSCDSSDVRDENNQDEKVHDYIDVEFFDVTDEPPAVHNDESKNEAPDDVSSRITADDWKRIAASLKKEHVYISEFRHKIMNSKKFNRKRRRNTPLRKDELLPGQLTIQGCVK